MSRLVFDTSFGGDIYTSDLDGTNWQRLVSGDDPYLSSDGRRIVFTNRVADSQGNTSQAIYLINLDGTGYQLLVENAQQPRWSPDGNYIAYLDGNGLSIIDPESRETQVFPLQYPSYYVWSPDSTQIAWAELDDDFTSQIHVTNLYREHQTFETIYNTSWNLAWSLDGRYVTVHWRPSRGSSPIRYADVVEVSTGLVMATYPSEYMPVWSASNKFMAYISLDGMLCLVNIDYWTSYCSTSVVDVDTRLRWLP